jgi:hypothetical protein
MKSITALGSHRKMLVVLNVVVVLVGKGDFAL